MLDLGFLPDVERIVAMTPENRQTMLFSATMPGVIVNLARRYMRTPTHIRATNPDDESATVDTVEQHVYRAHEMDKPELLARVLQAEGRGLTIVFTPHQARRGPGRRRPVGARLRCRRRARRPRPGRARAGAARVPRRQGRRARRDRRRRPRHRHRGRHARHQLHVPRGREDVPAPRRPYGAGRRRRRRDHARRLGRPAALVADQQGARACRSRTRPRRTRRRTGSTPRSTSPGTPRASCRTRPAPAPACRPRRSRTSARPGAHGAARRQSGHGFRRLGGGGGSRGDSRRSHGSGGSRGRTEAQAPKTPKSTAGAKSEAGSDGGTASTSTSRKRRNGSRRRTRSGKPVEGTAG